MINSNCHTHTTYCDGKNSAEEMVKAAIDLGFKSLGFSGHSPMNYENDWGMTKENLTLYISEIRELSEKYKDKIDILCGIELDCDYVDINTKDFDYIIASVHQFQKDGVVYPIDLSPADFSRCVDEIFGENWNEMAREYYKLVTDHVLSVDCDVVGHIDLITKFNDKGEQFDENDEEYQAIVIKAVDDIIDKKPDILFEVNTGAMYRRGNSKPYPAPFIMEQIKKRGGLITITADAHRCDALDFAFDKMIDYCKNFGFNEVYILTSNGREKIIL